jgi:hypothetical protein
LVLKKESFILAPGFTGFNLSWQRGCGKAEKLISCLPGSRERERMLMMVGALTCQLGLPAPSLLDDISYIQKGLPACLMLSGNAFIDIHRGLFYYSAGCISIQPS